MKAFIDDLRIVRVESEHFIYDIHLRNTRLVWFKNENGSQYFFCEKNIELHKEDTVYINHEAVELQIGLVTLTKEFEALYRYDGQLGAIYSKKETIFRVFSPVAKEIVLVLDDERYNMHYNQGIYEVTVPGDHDNKNYFFDVRLVREFHRTTDPYAKASNLKGPVVVDFDKTQKLRNFRSTIKNYTDAVLYEAHVRDLTINLDILNKGFYDGLIEYSPSLKGSVLDYVKNLGVTHLQLLPIFDFDDVFDDNKNLKYNWGYNPAQYFVLEGWYSKEPNNAYDRINKFKDVVAYAHNIGLAVNMDVVYNHVYQTHTFPYDYLVPGYFYRHDENNKRTNNSYCGNDVETRNYMVRKLIIDSLKHFVQTYKIDGFRFDLMGLMDIDTMLLIEKELKAINPKVMLYGEGWNMDNAVEKENRSHMHNYKKFPNYAHFNDTFRDTFRGTLHGKDFGYALGNQKLVKKALMVVTGSKDLFDYPSQSINYVECHDNYTFHDRMVQSMEHDKLLQDFATHAVIIARGIPFIHAGQEFYRTKKGVENSYNSPDDVNMIHWPKSQKAINKLRKLISIRNKYPMYRKNRALSKSNTLIKDNVIILKLSEKDILHKVYLKNDYSPFEIKRLDEKMIFGNDLINENNDTIILDKPGVYIIEKRG